MCITDMIGYTYISAGYLCVHYRYVTTRTLVQDTCVCITDMIGHTYISAGYVFVHYKDSLVLQFQGSHPAGKRGKV